MRYLLVAMIILLSGCVKVNLIKVPAQRCMLPEGCTDDQGKVKFPNNDGR